MKVLRATENTATIGFVDPRADQIAHIQNVRVRQFGVSPMNREVMIHAVNATLAANKPVAVNAEP